MIEDQFMFGPDILVAPVVKKGAVSRPVCLPAGNGWSDIWTGMEVAGGQCVTVDAPLERFPVFVRSGSPVFGVFQNRRKEGRLEACPGASDRAAPEQ